MARTALNVSGSMTAGIVTSRVLGMREARVPDGATGAGLQT
jgi:L-cystine uptake protein TcyP (sodium:dicarboxylate symporter family)